MKDLRGALFYLALGAVITMGAFVGNWWSFSFWIGGVLLGIGTAETFHALNGERVRR